MSRIHIDAGIIKMCVILPAFRAFRRMIRDIQKKRLMLKSNIIFQNQIALDNGGSHKWRYHTRSFGKY